MENVILGLLMIQSLTLYELNQSFKQGISMFYSASFGSLQAAVKSLLSKGWSFLKNGWSMGVTRRFTV